MKLRSPLPQKTSALRDTPEEVSEFELDFSSSSTSSSGSSSAASSAASSPRRSPRLEKKRSRILEKEGVSFLAKRRRVDPPSPVDPVASLPQSPVPGSGESSVERCSPSLPSTRSYSPSLPPSRSSPVCWESPAAGAAVQRSSASPSPPPPSAGRTTRSGRFHPYSKPASPAPSTPPPTSSPSPPPLNCESLKCNGFSILPS
ncbi:hypothetical protein CDAR_618971 [Caerostris darwini]|uniref:Uncharacterized protein n=1 Tax=Caerostris darwini TaxID=1538125 RepID=A0AAV4QXF8_9ARAC|nr:hypothetical protein CDAR_618971 [Caerostris darwini]